MMQQPGVGGGGGGREEEGGGGGLGGGTVLSGERRSFRPTLSENKRVASLSWDAGALRAGEQRPINRVERDVRREGSRRMRHRHTASTPRQGVGLREPGSRTFTSDGKRKTKAEQEKDKLVAILFRLKSIEHVLHDWLRLWWFCDSSAREDVHNGGAYAFAAACLVWRGAKRRHSFYCRVEIAASF